MNGEVKLQTHDGDVKLHPMNGEVKLPCSAAPPAASPPPPHEWGGKTSNKKARAEARAFLVVGLTRRGRSWRAGPSGSTRFRTKPSRHPGGRRSHLRCHCGGKSIPVRPRP